MKILLHPQFVKEFGKLPEHIKILARKKINIFIKNPFDSRLKTHQLHGRLNYLHAFYIDRKKYRLSFEILDKNVVRFYHIGTHDIYK